jgi:hypothetical protein
MNPQDFHLFIRRNLMDHDLIVEPLLARGKGFLETILQAADLQHVATASLAIFEQIRPVAREILPAKITGEAQQLKGTDVAPGGEHASGRDVHTRLVSPQTVCGEVCIPVRTFPCGGGGASLRPDDHHLGVPAVGDFPDDGRALYAPMVAERPHRVATDRWQRCTGGALSARGAQRLIDSPPQDLQPWQAEGERQEAAGGVDTLASGAEATDLRVEGAMDGVMAHIDGRGQDAKVATILLRRREAPAEEPTLGAIRARRSVGVLGSAEDLAVRITQVLRAAGWEHLALGEILGDGAPWLWTVAATHVPGVRQTLDYSHRSEPVSAFANLQDPYNPAEAKAWGDQQLGARLMDRRGEVLGALQRMRRCKTVLCSVERHRTRIRDQEPWHRGLAVGSGAVEGACQPVMQSRVTRAGMRWKQPGFLNGLALRIARLNNTLQAFWASRGLLGQDLEGV